MQRLQMDAENGGKLGGSARPGAEAVRQAEHRGDMDRLADLVSIDQPAQSDGRLGRRAVHRPIRV